jgi:hypothetical protein
LLQEQLGGLAVQSWGQTLFENVIR